MGQPGEAPQQSFSWLRDLSRIRARLQDNVDAGLTELRALLRAQAPQGFEIEMIGRILRGVTVESVTAYPRYRVGVVSSYTSEPLANALRVALLLEGYVGVVYEAPFNAYPQEILSPESGLYAFSPDAVLLALSVSSIEGLPEGPLPEAVVSDQIDKETERWRSVWTRLRERLTGPVLQHLFEVPEEEFLGIAELRAPWSARRYVERLNDGLLAVSPGFVSWLDLDGLAARVGRQHWRDARMYHHGKYGFAIRFLPEYTSLLRASLRTILGKAKKALVLDLDNTLWGGVIGDDRLEGVALGPDSAEGSAYAAFGRYVKQLGQRGVILAICSKNDHDIAMEVFEKHPHMPLKAGDFAVIACSWDDKATSLARVASDLNIDVSSLVFVDDNPAECELIRQRLPDVETVLMDSDPAEFIRKLDRLHLFDAQSLSSEDLTRAASYSARAKSDALRGEQTDMGSYLTSLQMRARIAPAGASELPRLAQMEMKTNQFNLATRRLDLETLSAMASSEKSVVLSVSLKDRFADHGIVSYAAATLDGDVVRITDWLMSCRVFSRTLEQFVFNEVVRRARDWSAVAIEAELKPTPKNVVMHGLFESLGFACVGQPPDGPWRYDMSSSPAPAVTYVADEHSAPESSLVA